MAQKSTMHCVLNAGRDINAEQIALNCGSTSEEVQAILAILEESSRREAEMLKKQDELRDLLVATLSASERYTSMLEAGITEEAIMSLAAKIASDVDDPKQALTELENFIPIAIEVMAAFRANPSTDEFLQAVMVKVQELNSTGDFQGGYEVTVAAIEEWNAARADSLRQGVELASLSFQQALLSRDPMTLATASIRDAAMNSELLALENGDEFENFSKNQLEEILFFALLTQISDMQLEMGFKHGAPFMIEASAIASEMAIERVSSNSAAAGLWVDAGQSLLLAYSLSSDPETALRAQGAFQEALLLIDEVSSPVSWSASHQGIGVALRYQAEHSGSFQLEMLEAADSSYELALRQRSETETPVEWGETMVSRANLLSLKAKLDPDEDGSSARQAAHAYQRVINSPEDIGGLNRALYARQLQWLSRSQDVYLAQAYLAEAYKISNELLSNHSKEDNPTEWLEYAEFAGTSAALLGLELGSHGGAKYLRESVKYLETVNREADIEARPTIFWSSGLGLISAYLDLATLTSAREKSGALESAASHLDELEKHLEEGEDRLNLSERLQRSKQRLIALQAADRQ